VSDDKSAIRRSFPVGAVIFLLCRDGYGCKAKVVDHDLVSSKVIVEYEAEDELVVSITGREEDQYFDGNCLFLDFQNVPRKWF
jgi:hypothetical protein